MRLNDNFERLKTMTDIKRPANQVIKAGRGEERSGIRFTMPDGKESFVDFWATTGAEPLTYEESFRQRDAFVAFLKSAGCKNISAD